MGRRATGQGQGCRSFHGWVAFGSRHARVVAVVVDGSIVFGLGLELRKLGAYGLCPESEPSFSLLHESSLSSS